MAIPDSARKLRLVERLTEVKSESRAAFEEWKRLIVSYSVRGAQVYDARITAAMNVYGITHLLTFNGSDFKRFRGITILEPKVVASQ